MTSRLYPELLGLSGSEYVIDSSSSCSPRRTVQNS